MDRPYYTDSYAARIRTPLEVARAKGNELWLAPSLLLFHPEGGGQPLDKGWVVSGEHKFELKAIVREKGQTFLRVSVPVAQQEEALRKINEDLAVDCEIDWEFRYKVMRYHSAVHVVMACLKKAIPGYVPKGMKIDSNLASASCRFFGSAPGDDVWIKNVEASANQHIEAGAAVAAEFVDSLEEAKARQPEHFRADDDLTLKPPIRMVRIEGLDFNPCGGTHVRNITEIGPVGVADYSFDEMQDLNELKVRLLDGAPPNAS